MTPKFPSAGQLAKTDPLDARPASVWPNRGNGRDAAIRPNKPDCFCAEFSILSLVLAHLLIKSPMQDKTLNALIKAVENKI